MLTHIQTPFRETVYCKWHVQYGIYPDFSYGEKFLTNMTHSYLKCTSDKGCIVLKVIKIYFALQSFMLISHGCNIPFMLSLYIFGRMNNQNS
jgi:hypothetical protein